MKIKSLHIKNFKSLVDVEIIDPNPFTVFVGANGVGKSNIFEALEFHLLNMSDDLKLRLFGGAKQVSNVKLSSNYTIAIKTDTFQIVREGDYFSSETKGLPGRIISVELNNDFEKEYVEKFQNIFSRIFIEKEKYQKINYSDSAKLNLSASNLEKVLKRLLIDENKREEIKELLQLLVPGFERLEIYSDNIGSTDRLLIYEKSFDKPFNKDVLSDGTYNLICLLTAVLQSDEPQFLCIEEPENGLTPDVIKEMVTLFRNACEEKGHYIWLNTHSQTLVSQLTSDEIITVDKINGETKIKQFKGKDFHGLRMDEAWLTNSLGAGLPW